jgi:flagellar basal-body rod protein FlgF
MQIGMYQSVSGMKAMMAYQNDLAANLARQSVVGGRSTITAFELLEEQPNQKKGMLGLNRPVAIEMRPVQTQSVVNFSQGALQRTDNPLDFAIQGEAFFSVREPGVNSETPRYTREGQFRIDNQGNVLTSDGSQLLLEGGTPLQLDPRGSKEVSVLSDGTVYVAGQNNPVGRLKLTHFDDPRQALQATSTGRFEVMDATRQRDGAAPNDRVEQGFVESANMNAIAEMVNLVSVMRNYESNQRAAQVQDEANGRLIRTITETL